MIRVQIEKPVGWTSDDWSTPSWLILQLEHEFGPFDVDVCCRPETAKAPRYFTRDEDGLQQPWTGRVWCNPPYSDVAPWIAKAIDAARSGAFVAMLLPAAVDTAWFHDLVLPHGEIRYIRGRVGFIGWLGTPIRDPRTPSMLVFFGAAK